MQYLLWPSLCPLLDLVIVVAVLFRLPKSHPANKIVRGSVFGLLFGSLLFLMALFACCSTSYGLQLEMRDLSILLNQLLTAVTIASPGAAVGGILAYYILGRNISDESRQILTVAIGSGIGTIAPIICAFFFAFQV